MNTHETYVSLEVAKLLKQAGFDWEVKDRWDYAPILKKEDAWFLRHWPEEPVNWNAKEREAVYKYEPSISAPTLAIAQKWLREVKDKQVHVISYRDQKTGKLQGWCYKVYEMSQGWEFNYFTYEEALEEGIKKCLTLLLK